MKCDFDYCKYFKEKQCMSNNGVYSSCKYRHYYYFFKSIDEVLNMNEDITKFILDFIIKENILNGDDLYKKNIDPLICKAFLSDIIDKFIDG